MTEKQYVDLGDLNTTRITRDIDFEDGRSLRISFKPYALSVEEDRSLRDALEDPNDYNLNYLTGVLAKAGLKVGKDAEDLSAKEMSAEEMKQKMSHGLLFTVYREFTAGLRPNLKTDAS